MISKRQFTAVIFIVIIVTSLLTWSVNNFVVYGIGDEMTGKFRTIAGIIQRNSYHDLSDDALQDGSISGMVASLNDPDSTYLSPQEAQAFDQKFLAEYTGIGVRTTKIISGFMVVDVAAESPAARSGIKLNDVLIKVNGEDIRGANGTINDVLRNKNLEQLTVLRAETEVNIAVEPARVDFTNSISTIHNVGDKKILVFDMQRFTDRTYDLFVQDLKRLESEPIDGVIIDLRNNEGGSVDVARKILAASVRGKDEEGNAFNYLTLQNKDQAKKAKEARDEGREAPKDAFDRFVASNTSFQIKQPTVILMNQKTASAAEMVAAAMNEIDGIPLIGSMSLGKGTVQELIPIVSDGSAIKLTTKKWFTHTQRNLTPEHALEPTIVAVDSIPYTIRTVGADKEYKTGDKDTPGSRTIADIQMILGYFGYETKRADGLFDRGTETQLKKFQEDNGIRQSGRIDMPTLQKVNEKLIAYTKNVKNDTTMQKAFEQLQVLSEEATQAKIKKRNE